MKSHRSELSRRVLWGAGATISLGLLLLGVFYLSGFFADGIPDRSNLTFQESENQDAQTPSLTKSDELLAVYHRTTFSFVFTAVKPRSKNPIRMVGMIEIFENEVRQKELRQSKKRLEKAGSVQVVDDGLAVEFENLRVTINGKVANKPLGGTGKLTSGQFGDLQGIITDRFDMQWKFVARRVPAD